MIGADRLDAHRRGGDLLTPPADRFLRASGNQEGQLCMIMLVAVMPAARYGSYQGSAGLDRARLEAAINGVANDLR